MKKIIYIVIYIILFKPVFPVVDYVINYDYITTVLCENVDKLALHCNGKCHLKKELASEVSNDTSQSNNQKNNTIFMEVLFCEQLIDYTFIPKMYLDYKNNSFYNCTYSLLNSFSIFHPPLLA